MPLILVIYLIIAAWISGGAFGSRDKKDKDFSIIFVSLICLLWPIIIIYMIFKKPDNKEGVE